MALNLSPHIHYSTALGISACSTASEGKITRFSVLRVNVGINPCQDGAPGKAMRSAADVERQSHSAIDQCKQVGLRRVGCVNKAAYLRRPRFDGGEVDGPVAASPKWRYVLCCTFYT